MYTIEDVTKKRVTVLLMSSNEFDELMSMLYKSGFKFVSGMLPEYYHGNRWAFPSHLNIKPTGLDWGIYDKPIINIYEISNNVPDFDIKVYSDLMF
jgi:hypothetical protein